MLNEYDRQIGRLLETLHVMGLDSNTIVVFAADNDPEPSFEHARTLGQRGMKWSLYEGGIREPFFVRWPGHIPAAKTNNVTVLSSVDYFPTICALAAVLPPAKAPFDGIDQSRPWEGAAPQRSGPIGLMLIAIVRTAGVNNIIAIDGNAGRLSAAREMGADYIINFRDYPTRAGLIEALNAVTKGMARTLPFK